MRAAVAAPDSELAAPTLPVAPWPPPGVTTPSPLEPLRRFNAGFVSVVAGVAGTWRSSSSERESLRGEGPVTAATSEGVAMAGEDER